MMLLFGYGVGVTQPKESDLGGESLAEREQIKLAAQSCFTRTVSKDVLELMMWEPAQCELLRLGVFQKLISGKSVVLPQYLAMIKMSIHTTQMPQQHSGIDKSLVFLPFYKKIHTMTLGQVLLTHQAMNLIKDLLVCLLFCLLSTSIYLFLETIDVCVCRSNLCEYMQPGNNVN